jgi:hypothetical protein
LIHLKLSEVRTQFEASQDEEITLERLYSLPVK